MKTEKNKSEFKSFTQSLTNFKLNFRKNIHTCSRMFIICEIHNAIRQYVSTVARPIFHHENFIWFSQSTASLTGNQNQDLFPRVTSLPLSLTYIYNKYFGVDTHCRRFWKQPKYLRQTKMFFFLFNIYYNTSRFCLVILIYINNPYKWNSNIGSTCFQKIKECSWK